MRGARHLLCELSSSAADRTATETVYQRSDAAATGDGKLAHVRHTVHVKPGSRKGPLVEEAEGTITVFLRERAVDGAANTGLVRVLADHFHTSPSRVTIVRGHTSRIKVVEIEA